MSASVKLLIATPARPPVVHVNYVHSLLGTMNLLAQRGIKVANAFEPGNPVIGMARSDLVAHFLKIGGTHLLMVDADVQWPPTAVLRLLEHDVEFCAVVGAHSYTGQLKHEMGRVLDATNRDLIEVESVGGMFWLLKRAVIEKMIAAYPELIIKGRHVGECYALFAEVITGDGQWLSEDFGFCHRWRKAGGRIFVDPAVELRHHVEWVLTGRLAEQLDLGALAAARSVPG